MKSIIIDADKQHEQKCKEKNILKTLRLVNQ